jgi:hypothetical protein
MNFFCQNKITLNALNLFSLFRSDEDVIAKMSGMHLDQDNDLSSDDEDFIYSKDDYPEHGDAYSKYKKRVMKDLQGSDYESDSGDSSDDQIVEDLD